MSKIIVDRVELKNFLSYGNQWTEFDFQSGVNVVLGHDKDKERSNGAGKSSFLEAIPFALFGQINKGISLPKIVNWRNGKQCEVKLYFQKDGIKYMIHRGIKPGILTLFKDGVEVPKLSDKRLFQAELENDLIGMDFKAAQALLFQNANNMVSLFNTPKAEKRRFIEKFFNLEVYSKANEVTNKKLQGVLSRLSEIGVEVTYTEKQIQDLFNKISSFVPPNLDVYQGNVDTIMTRYDDFMSANPDLEDSLRVLQGERSDLCITRDYVNRDLSAEKQKLADIRLEIRTLSTEASTKRERYEKIGDLSDQRDKFTKVREALTKFDGLEEQIKSRKELLDLITEDINEEKSKIRECRVYAKQHEEAIVKQQKFFVTEESTCPTCFQEVDQAHIKDHIHTLMKGFEYELDMVNGEIKTRTEGLKVKESQFEEANNTLGGFETQLTKKRQLEQALAKLSGLEEKELEQNELEQRITELDTSLIPESLASEDESSKAVEEIQGRFDVIFRELDVHDEQINKCKDSIRERDKLCNELDTSKSILDNQKEIHDRLIGENEANITTKAKLESEIVSTQAEVRKLETMKDYLDHIKFTLKDENVKQYAISNIVPYLQQQTNHYLAETGHNYYVELDNWLDGTIQGFGVGDCDFGSMSGGEGKSIDLALKFAMMDVARRQAGSYLDILVLDELLDSSIDSFGLEKTMDIVRLKQREDNLKVFIVSHREEVSAFEADNIYQVTKENGMSTVSRIDG